MVKGILVNVKIVSAESYVETRDVFIGQSNSTTSTHVQRDDWLPELPVYQLILFAIYIYEKLDRF